MDYQTLLHTLKLQRPADETLRHVVLRYDGKAFYLAEKSGGRRTLRASELTAIMPALRELCGLDPNAPSHPRWALILPGHKVHVRFLDLPSTSPDELRAMARLQALPQLPFAEDELLCDIVILESDPDRAQSRVLLVIARQQTIEEQLRFCLGPDQWPDGFVLNSLGLMAAVRRTLGEGVTDYLHLDVSEGWTTIDWIQNGQLQRSRSVPVACRLKDVDRLVEECRKSIAEDVRPPLMVLTGPVHQIESGVEAALSQRLALRVQVLPSPEDFPAAVVGAADLPAQSRINLLPTAIQSARRARRLSEEVRSTALWLGVWLGSVLFAGVWGIAVKHHRLTVLDQQLHQLGPAAKKAEGAAERAAVIHDLSSRRGLPLDCLQALHAQTPEGLTLRTFSYQPTGAITMQGRASELSRVMAFLKSLQQSPLFIEMELHGTSLQQSGNADRIDFQIQGRLATPPSEFAYE